MILSSRPVHGRLLLLGQKEAEHSQATLLDRPGERLLRLLDCRNINSTSSPVTGMILEGEQGYAPLCLATGSVGSALNYSAFQTADDAIRTQGWPRGPGKNRHRA